MAVGLASALVVAMAVVTAPACRLSEYFCDNGRCVPLNRYCDAANDCGDSSDEPRFCTPCNRTYYGDVGKTYEIELHRPKEDRLPFVCLLTFTAGGDDLGDIVQLTFDSFTMGRFVSFTSDGCPDGSLQISETDRPKVGGSWCGTSWGSAIYYSETRTVTLQLRLVKLSRDQTGYNFDFRLGFKMLPRDSAVVRFGGSVPGVLAPGSSQGNGSSPSVAPEVESPDTPRYYLGDLIAGTYCSRIFSDCDQKPCRLQSPNFPGIYPRNLTCYYAVRQHQVPAGKQALIAVKQPKGQLVAIRSQSALYGSSTNQQHHNRELKVWGECDDVQDYVTIYDGYTTRDPALLKFCGGGEAVPPAVSSGPELLVEFTTSPYGTFLYPAPLHALHGFQLEVEVRFVDAQSPTYSKNKRCEFWIRGNDKGTLETPQHSLSPNTTCLYHLQGMDPNAPPAPPGRYHDVFTWRRDGQIFSTPRYRVWLSILKFHVSSTIDPQLQGEEQCASQLRVWDGALKVGGHCNDLFCEQESAETKSRLSMLSGTSSSGSSGKHQPNATLLARYCKDHIPKSCDHSLLTNATRYPRPCSLSETFLSTTDSLTIELRLAESTALRPVAFRALYEFVDLQQDGEPYGTGLCSRKFVSRSQGPLPDSPRRFQSPRNIFLFGRGGKTNLTCTYRFEAQKGERVRLLLTKLRADGRNCVTVHQPDLGRLQCHGNVTASVRVFEHPWPDTPPLARDCLCSGDNTIIPFSFTSTANVVEVRFKVTGMGPRDDYDGLHFAGTWEFIRTPLCPRKQRMSGASGELKFRSPSRTPEEVNCENHPWLIEPGPGRFLYVKLVGIFLQHQVDVVEVNLTAAASNATTTPPPPPPPPRTVCKTRNRIAVHSGGSVHVVVCPQPPGPQRHHLVEIFSEGWVISSTRLVHEPVLAHVTTDQEKLHEQSRNVVVEFLAHEPGSYTVTWLELSRRRPVLPPAEYVREEDCVHRCPELDACINASLWCDGTDHCPSGYDEEAVHCSFLLQLPLLYLGLGAGGLLAVSVSLCLVGGRACRRRNRTALQRRLKSLSQDTSTLGSKEVIC